MDETSLLKFIGEAHLCTFAAPKETRERYKIESHIPGHKCYFFTEGDFEYYDTYAEGQCTSGRGVVLFKNEPVWSMIYQGSVADNLEQRFVDGMLDFLRTALRIPPQYMPFRGPSRYPDQGTQDGLVYTFKLEEMKNHTKPHFEHFKGKEQITFNGVPVFFHDVMGQIIR